MTVVDLCAPLGADRRPRFHRSVVALGTADISLEILGSCHACLLVGNGHTGGRFYCSGGYSDILPSLFPLPQNHCNSGELDIADTRADSAPYIWDVPGGVPGRFVAEVGVALLSVPRPYAG